METLNKNLLILSIISTVLTIILTIMKLISVKIENKDKLPPRIKSIFSNQYIPWGLVVLLFVANGALFYIFLNQPKIPLEVFKSYSFENMNITTDTKPWFPNPPVKKYPNLISKEIAYAHSGSNSYQLKVDMKPFPSNPAFEFAGIMISDPNLKELTDVKLITAWVFIPDSEPLRDHNFQGHIAASKNNIAGTPVVFIGEDTKIEPGKWTRLVLGTFQDTSFIPNFKWNGDINILNINVFCDKDYDGSIYFDDITFYK